MISIKPSIISLLAAILLLSGAARAGKILVSIEGSKQGLFKSDDSSNKIAVTGLSFDVKSPRDMATGQASGKVQNGPITITKTINASSPQIFQATVSNEVLKSVIIEVYGTSPDGQETVTSSMKLTNATISGVKQSMNPDAGANAAPIEEVTFTFQKMEYGNSGGSVADTVPLPAVAPISAAPAAPAPAPLRVPVRPRLPQ